KEPSMFSLRVPRLRKQNQAHRIAVQHHHRRPLRQRSRQERLPAPRQPHHHHHTRPRYPRRQPPQRRLHQIRIPIASKIRLRRPPTVTYPGTHASHRSGTASAFDPHTSLQHTHHNHRHCIIHLFRPPSNATPG